MQLWIENMVTVGWMWILIEQFLYVKEFPN